MIDKTRMGVFKFGVVVLVAGFAACGSEKVDQCNKDSDCTNIAYPFCDVNGEFPTSEGDAHVCIPVPTDCPIDRCGCSPGATTCSNDALSICNLDGKSTSMTTCDLGCAGAGDRCKSFDPGFGLQDALVASTAEPDVTITAHSTLDTDTGALYDSAHILIPVTHRLVAQPSGPDIQVYLAHTFKIEDLVISGHNAVAFVASGSIDVHGKVDASANSVVAGPGAVETGTCVGGWDPVGMMGAGGGNAVDGGTGGSNVSGHSTIAGGLPESGLVALVGGCRGGSADGTAGGAGGGAIVLASFTGINVSGLLDVGGGGAGGGTGVGTGTGGGAGGNIVLEASMISITGSVTANGGAGGACQLGGGDGAPTAVPAFGGGGCTGSPGPARGGAGGIGSAGPGGGISNLNTGAGGGGSVGRLLIRTSTGAFTPDTGALISAVSSVSALDVH